LDFLRGYAELFEDAAEFGRRERRNVIKRAAEAFVPEDLLDQAQVFGGVVGTHGRASAEVVDVQLGPDAELFL